MTFANGTEWDSWSHAWCGTCKHDINDDCEIVLKLLTGERPVEIGRGPMWSPQTVCYCTKYEPIPSSHIPVVATPFSAVVDLAAKS